MVTKVWNPSPWKVEAGRSGVQITLGYIVSSRRAWDKTPSHNNNNQTNKKGTIKICKIHSQYEGRERGRRGELNEVKNVRVGYPGTKVSRETETASSQDLA